MAARTKRGRRVRRGEGLPAQPNQSLAGGMDVLGALVAAGRELGSRELARELHMEPTRANRLLGTLAYMGLAERTAGRKYMPGPAVHVLAAMSLRGSRLLSAALPHLERLAADEPERSVALGVRWRRQVAYLYFHRPGEKPQVAIVGNDLYPAEKSSIGQVLLAGLDAAELRELYADRDSAEVEALLAELGAVRERGWALVDERTLGVALGQPAFAGLALAGADTAPNAGRLVARLRLAAAAIAADMG